MQGGLCPAAFVDNNPCLAGTFVEIASPMFQIPVISYETLKAEKKSFCILITTVIEKAYEIYRQLKEAGEQNPILFCANPSKAENRFLSPELLEQEKEKFEFSYSLLKDTRSKVIFKELVYWKMTGDLSGMQKYTEYDFCEMFDNRILKKGCHKNYIDAGSYTGDSLCRYLAAFGGDYENIYGIEPDEQNFKALQHFITYARLPNVTLYKKALWREKAAKKFFTVSQGLGNYESSNLFRDVNEMVDNNIKAASPAPAWAHSVETDTLDNMFLDKKTTLIKLDVLASEVPILYGASGLIQMYKPSIVMEYGTHIDYFADTIPYLNKQNPKYEYILRAKRSFGNNRVFLYIIDKK